jgi:cation-transporting ATPase 13A3/4/5
MVTIMIAVIFTTFTILFPPSWLASILQLTDISFSFASLMIAIALGNFVLSWISEKVLFVYMRDMLDRFAGWRRKRKHWGGKIKEKRYQIVEAGM